MNKLEKKEVFGWGMFYATFMIFVVYLLMLTWDEPINIGTFIVPFGIALFNITSRKYRLEVKFINIKKFNDSIQEFNDSTEWERVEGRRGEL